MLCMQQRESRSKAVLAWVCWLAPALLVMAPPLHAQVFLGCANLSAPAATLPSPRKLSNSQVDGVVCANAELTRLANAVSQAELARRDAPGADARRSEGREWTREVRNACRDEACLLRAYSARLDVLEGRLSPPPTAARAPSPPPTQAASLSPKPAPPTANTATTAVAATDAGHQTFRLDVAYTCIKLGTTDDSFRRYDRNGAFLEIRWIGGDQSNQVVRIGKWRLAQRSEFGDVFEYREQLALQKGSWSALGDLTETVSKSKSDPERAYPLARAQDGTLQQTETCNPDPSRSEALRKTSTEFQARAPELQRKVASEQAQRKANETKEERQAADDEAGRVAKAFVDADRALADAARRSTRYERRSEIVCAQLGRAMTGRYLEAKREFNEGMVFQTDRRMQLALIKYINAQILATSVKAFGTSSCE